MPKTTHEFQGFRSPNYTMVPDELFDELLVDLTGAELKVLLYIVRRTFGFKREADSISLSQMLKGIQTGDGRVLDRGAGLSKPTLLQALRSLVDKMIIETERRRSAEKGDEPTVYKLRFAPDTRGQKLIPPVVKKLDQGGGKQTEPGGWSKNLTTQETVLQETEQQHVVVEGLTEFGVARPTAHKLASEYPAQYILDKLDFVQWLSETKSSLVAKNPAGYLRKALEDDYQPPPIYRPPAQRKADAKKRQLELDIEEKERREAEAEFLRAKENARKALRKEFPPQKITGTKLTTETAWAAVLELLSRQMTSVNFGMWFKETTLVSCGRDSALIVVATPYQLEWVRNRFTPLIQKQLQQVLGFVPECKYLSMSELQKPEGQPSRKIAASP